MSDDRPRRTADDSADDAPRRRLTWRGRLGLVLLGVLLSAAALAVVEGALTVFGVGDDYLYDDPFVGFAPGSDLFERQRTADGSEVYATRPEKLAFFNAQSFAADKPADGYRVFTVGGSTTAGRPYDDRVAFARWLGLYLDAADPSRSWEVVNAGAISYASYRVVLLMRELVRYEPDLFVVYTGHNEFLEERSYEDILNQPQAVKRLRMWLSGFRFAALVRHAFAGGGGGGKDGAQDAADGPTTLAPEVVARLDGWTGVERYHRDDPFAASVVEHFEYNLRQMVHIARDHGARVIFVEPVSNLADFSPFKSQHTPGLAAADRRRAADLLTRGREALDHGDPAAAVTVLGEAARLDPRHAEIQYRLGRALLARGDAADADAAYDAFVRAKDEDVAPLRAIEPLVAAVDRVARQEDVPLVPLRHLLEADSRQRFGHAALGDAYLLDHVHPDVPIHSRIAEEVLQRLVDDGTADPTAAWNEARRRQIFERETGAFDREYYARRDLNLAKVLGWAGKLEEAEPALLRAADVLPDEPEVWLNLGIVYQRTGRYDAALEALSRARALAADWELVQFNLGVVHGHLGQLDAGVAALRRALEIHPDYPEAEFNLAVLLRRRGDLDASLAALDRAEQLGADAAQVEVNRGLVYRRQGRLADAEALFRRLVESAPDDAEARTELAITLGRRGALEEAATQLQRALESDPEYAEALYNLGVVRAQQGDLAAAEEAYVATLGLQPRHAQAHNNLGILLARRGEVAAARSHFEAAVAADPGYAEARFNLGVALDGMGQPEQALESIRRAVELDPDNARFHLALGQLYAARGDVRSALEHLEAARAGGQTVPDALLAELRRRAG